ncbi:MAG: methylenetetrahydrofolate reductase C-terminal domain-containing protein [Nitrospiraceae bacterium]|nr:methylenetetrahydrofolate reductase C-terminal domain-containing protein [Nitrospiraceae bacterium]
MIITKKKDRKKLLESTGRYNRFFLLGCSECATLCGTGGQEQIDELKKELEESGKTVTGGFVAKTGCQALGTKVELKQFKEALDNTDCVIVMSCGAGTQSAVEIFPEKAVYPSNDSLFLGNMTRLQMFDERCSLCGECVLDLTGGVCPVTACPKGILNGPCGGTKDGHCEISAEIPCAWVRIYDRMNKLGRLEEFGQTTLAAKDWSASIKPRKLNVREQKDKKSGGEEKKK